MILGVGIQVGDGIMAGEVEAGVEAGEIPIGMDTTMVIGMAIMMAFMVLEMAGGNQIILTQDREKIQHHLALIQTGKLEEQLEEVEKLMKLEYQERVW
jgi:hypothetical protein